MVVRETPVKSRKERRKKSSQGSEEGGRSESQLLRRSFITYSSRVAVVPNLVQIEAFSKGFK